MDNKLFTTTKLTCYLIFVLSLVVAFQTVAFSSEADRNRKINSQCESKALRYSDGDGQTTPHCQQAIKNQCLVDNLGKYYPDAKSNWKSRVEASCEILANMSNNICPPCK